MLFQICQVLPELLDRNACGRVFVLLAEMMVNKGANLRFVLPAPIHGVFLRICIKQSRQNADKNDCSNYKKNPLFNHKTSCLSAGVARHRVFSENGNAKPDKPVKILFTGSVKL